MPADVLIKDLLNMTSGISYTPGANGRVTEPSLELQKKLEILAGRIHNGTKLSHAELYNEIGTVPLVFSPGDKWDYGMSADIMGAIIEIVTGKDLSRFYAEEIFEPLGMRDTGYTLTEEQQSRLAKMGKLDNNGRIQPMDETNFAKDCNGASFVESGGGGWMPVTYGGLYSTMDDYAKFCSMLLHNGVAGETRILSEQTVSLFSQNHLNADQAACLWPGLLDGYGYGNFMRVMVDRTKAQSNGRNGEYGWDGFLGTYFFIDPVSDLYLVYMQQATADFSVRRKIRNIIYGAM